MAERPVGRSSGEAVHGHNPVAGAPSTATGCVGQVSGADQEEVVAVGGKGAVKRLRLAGARYWVPRQA